MKKIYHRLRIFFSTLRNAENIKTKISRIGLGLIFFQILNKIGIVLVNPVILYLFELKIAIVFMIIASFLIRYSLILIYDSQKIDWFLIEEFKSLQSKGEYLLKKDHNLTIKIMIFLFKFGKIVLLIVLLGYDPFLTVIYQRPGYNRWNKIPNIKIFGLFILSTIVCAFISIAWISPIVEIIR